VPLTNLRRSATRLRSSTFSSVSRSILLSRSARREGAGSELPAKRSLAPVEARIPSQASLIPRVGRRDEHQEVVERYLADFRADFHDIRNDPAYANCLDPNSYTKSQSLARELLAQASAGLLYRSVRRKGGTCIACFRPALVVNVRKGFRSLSGFILLVSHPQLFEHNLHSSN